MLTTLDRLRIIIARNLRCAETAVALEASLKEDLGADALDLLALWVELENEFAVTIPDARGFATKTVGEALCLIEELMAAGSPPPVREPAKIHPASERARFFSAMGEDEEMRAARPTRLERLKSDMDIARHEQRPFTDKA